MTCLWSVSLLYPLLYQHVTVEESVLRHTHRHRQFPGTQQITFSPSLAEWETWILVQPALLLSHHCAE